MATTETKIPEIAPLHPEPAQPQGLLGQAWAGFRGTLRDAVRYGELRHTPYGLRPALLMGGTYLVYGFNASIFSIALPDIVRDREINAVALLSTMNMLSFLLIFATVGLAYALDRVRRIPFFAGGNILQGVFSLLTGNANTVWTIGSTRAADAIADTAGSVPLFSLAADYYPVESRGKMFALTGTLSRLGARTSPLLIGLLIVHTSWRVPFYISGSMLLVLGVVCLFALKEPVRGYMERKALGLPEEEALTPEPAPSFGEAWRTIWGIRTIRRLFIGGICAGIGERVIVFTYPLFLYEHYRLDAFGRGRITFVTGMFALVGGVIGGGIVDSLIKRRPQRVLVFSGLLSVGAAMLVSAQASAPPVWMLYALGALYGFFAALIGPARNVFYAQILPANMRTAGLGVFALGDIPAVIVFGLFTARLTTWGFQGVLFAAVPFLVLGALIDMTASGLFERDVRNAMQSQLATQEYRKAREAGRLKMLVCKGVEVDYDGVQVLFGVDLEVETGEIVALLGTNGAGKSTLLKAIAGTKEASGGAIVFDGRDTTHVPPYEVADRGVVLMPGGKGVFPGLSVRENLSLGTWGLDDAEAKRRIDEVLGMFPVLNAKQGARAGTMSGGEQQMLALAMAFLSKPRLLLIDELSLGLAPAVVQELLQAVRAVRDRGVTIVLVEQSVNVALTVAERAVFMEKGEVKFTGPTADLLNRPDILRAVYVKGAAAIGADARTAAERRDQELAGQRAPVLVVEDLGVSFGGVRALDGVSFDLPDGQILGIIGPNGAGKTTLFDCISGFVQADTGRVLLEGTDVGQLPAARRAKLQLVRRFQDARLYPSLSVFETVMVALDRHHRARSIVAGAVGTPRARASERLLRRRADELIDLLGLGAARDKFVRELSTGMRRIVDLACTIAMEPKVLLLDEPSSGIAQAEAEAMAPLLRRIRTETGCSMLLIEHDMPLITRTADELMAMVQGRVVVRGSAEQVLSHPTVVESYLGTSEEVVNRSGALR